MRRLWGMVVCAALVGGCVTTDTKAGPQLVSTLKPGVTTIEDAERLLGQPNDVAKLPDGTTLVQYIYVCAKASGSSFIPVVGAFTGHSDVDHQATNLLFDQQGKFLRSWGDAGHTSASLMGHH